MAIYLGENKVSPLFLKTIEKTITIDSNNNQTIVYNNDTNYNIEDPDDLSYNRETTYTTWIRPNNWPNLDAITLEDDFEGVYFTYKNTEETPYKLACFYCVISGGTKYNIDMGHLNNNNEFVADKTTIEGTHNTYQLVDYSGIDSELYPYILIRLTPISTTQHFTRCVFGRIPVANNGTTVYTPYYGNFCYERKGKLPYVNIVTQTTTNASTNYGYVTGYMEKDATIIGTKNPITGTNFVGCWYNGFNLKVIDFTGWNTTNWTITSLASVFRTCYNLEYLDLSIWNTTNWNITSLSYMFGSMFNIRHYGFENWNTFNWHVTNLDYVWNANYSIEEINLENWNTSNWRVTTLANTWYNCFKLKKLELSSWNTSNWAVTSLANTWYNNVSLLSTNLSKWNTSNWAVTSLASTWYANYRRRNFKDIENWDTSNWAVTTLASTWYNCSHVTSLNLNNWNTVKWKVTTLASTWYQCLRLNELKIGNWQVNGNTTLDSSYTGWALTTLASTWGYCRNLKHIEALDWTVTKAWAITDLSGTFRYCSRLKDIDFTKWNVTAFAPTTIAGMTSECFSLQKLIMTGINLNITTANNYGATTSSGQNTILYYCFSLKQFDPPSNWDGRIYLNTTYSLSREEILKFFNNLETRDSAIGITIGTERYKLTAADIKIATDKGYTIS